ncbi:MAG: FMN-binding glutamate synthase family protein, partial [Candidatus Hydrogenedentota bacterium]
AFHFKAGQGAKTGTGGHLPGEKNHGKISQIRGIPEGEPAISPPTFEDLNTPQDFKKFADKVREFTGGIPIGFKISANRLEETIQFAVEASADYIILDGRGGGTGAAPTIFRDNISIPTIPALAKARKILNHIAPEVTLVITGGLRLPEDFVKALCLGADGIAISNAALQAIGCLGMRACHTNRCPVGIATQDKKLRSRLQVEKSAQRLATFLLASTELMKVLARACGHKRLSDFHISDLITWKKEMADLTGIEYAGV